MSVVVVFFLLAAWGRGLDDNLFNVFLDPSGKHLYSFLTSKVVLGLAAVYFASTCVFYSAALQNARDDLSYCREILGRSFRTTLNQRKIHPSDQHTNGALPSLSQGFRF